MSNNQLTISSKTLFHFTDKIENVINILETEFRPHFCLEDLNIIIPDLSSRPEFELAIPMICFCDIPLSQARVHMKTYGEYGIGLSKEWGKQNKISPVLYVHENSAITFGFRKMLEKVLDLFLSDNVHFDIKPTNIITNIKDIANVFDELEWIMSFIKPYEGKLWRNGKYTSNNIRFYDEREWRFVPKLPEDFLPRRLTKAEYSDQKQEDSANQKLKEITALKFEPSDIKYIIVSNESEIIPIIDEIKRIKSKYNQDQIKLLCSRVISSEQILEDF
ncbi:MAG: abortive infection system antitoxin AbiGi family protein [Candidatus Methanoperedens sp.]|nr:abortive infection system antitoxin AbiGi family protein [Candidatus Methanoperedens sp.]